jgi:hypothetical protein
LDDVTGYPNELTINITGTGFNALTANDDLSGWFVGTNELPSGLTAVVKENVAEGDTSVTVKFGGTTPDKAHNDEIDMKIPGTALQSGEDLALTPYFYVRWRIWNAKVPDPTDPTDPTDPIDPADPILTGQVGTQISIDPITELPTNKSFTIEIYGDSFYGVTTTAATAWLKNKPAGLSFASSGALAAGTTLMFTFTGVPTAAVDENLEIVIPAGALISNRELVIGISNLRFKIDPAP